MAGKFVNDNLDFVVTIIVAVVLLVPLGYGVVVYASSGGNGGSGPFLEKPDPKHTACLEDTEYMRLNHMDLLKRIRVESVREGKRGEIHWGRCRECHTSREKFCDKCHDMVNLELDCFGCHYYPK